MPEVVVEGVGLERGGKEGKEEGSETQMGACRLFHPNEQETDLGEASRVHCLSL